MAKAFKKNDRGAGSPFLTDVVRTFVRSCGKSLYVVSRETGIAYMTLHGFMSGKNVRTPVLDKLGSYLGLELRQRSSMAKPTKPRAGKLPHRR